jgi:hypothetical protein
MSALPNLTDCGLKGIKAVPYGVHMCHFYEGREDLAAALVPYFVAGLRNEERCVWVTAEPLDAHAAKAELARTGLNVDALERKGSLIIRDASDWFASIDRLDGAKAKIMDLWLDEERRALAAGYNGLRITGNTAFVNRADWAAFMEYEEYAEEAFASQRIVALCSYLLDRRAGADVLDVVRRHSCTLDRPDEGGWQVLANQRYGLAHRGIED